MCSLIECYSCHIELNNQWRVGAREKFQGSRRAAVRKLGGERGRGCNTVGFSFFPCNEEKDDDRVCLPTLYQDPDLPFSS